VRTTVNLNTIETTFVTDNPNKFERLVTPTVTASVPGAKYTWNFRNGDWDGKVCLVKKTDNHFTVLTGLVPTILEALKGTSLDFRDFRGLNTPNLQQSNVQARPYQAAATNAALSHTLPDLSWFPRGIIKVATGGGKTEIAVMIYEMNPVPTMFIVHRKDLMTQTIDRFKSYGHSVGQIGGGDFKPDSKFTVATFQTIRSTLAGKNEKKKKALVKLLNNCEQVFFDEAHLMASSLDRGNTFCDIAKELRGANCRWGLTATPFMRDNYSNLLLEGITGKLLYEIGSAELIKLGYLTPPKIIMLKVPGKLQIAPPRGRRSNKASGDHWRKVFDLGIKYHPARNQLIAKELLRGQGPNLCLVTTIEQAKYIQTITGSSVPLLDGSDDADTRKAAIEGLRSGKIRAIIVTTIFDEGIDIPELRKIIMGSGGKAPVKALQRLGRGTRLAANKEEVEIIDFNDAHHAILQRHTEARRAIYKAEGLV
jgi:superfamily II DNA or RNA helicase